VSVCRNAGLDAPVKMRIVKEWAVLDKYYPTFLCCQSIFRRNNHAKTCIDDASESV